MTWPRDPLSPSHHLPALPNRNTKAIIENFMMVRVVSKSNQQQKEQVFFNNSSACAFANERFFELCVVCCCFRVVVCSGKAREEPASKGAVLCNFRGNEESLPKLCGVSRDTKPFYLFRFMSIRMRDIHFRECPFQ